ncbi:hypothetical protein DBV15_04785, partial [Temnothorax longispinosus]
CKEYADLVYETEKSPTLRINAGSNRVSRCAVVETPLIIGGIQAKPAEFPHMYNPFIPFRYNPFIPFRGDSGGPLQRVLAEPYCMYSIVGVTSFGKFCAFKDSPAIYTRISSYLDWIENTVWP